MFFDIEVAALPRRVLALLCAGAALVVPVLAFAQEDLRRPVRQVEMDDGVIEITNSRATESSDARVVTAVSAIQAGPVRAASGASESPRDAAALGTAKGAAQPGSTPSSTGTASWLLPFIVVVGATGVSVWGLRRRRSLLRSLRADVPHAARPFVPREMLGDASAGSDTDDARPGAPLEGGQLDGEHLDHQPVDHELMHHGQWATAVRDSVPPSSPPRSSRSANAPRQWVSQPLRVKSDES